MTETLHRTHEEPQKSRFDLLEREIAWSCCERLRNEGLDTTNEVEVSLEAEEQEGMFCFGTFMSPDGRAIAILNHYDQKDSPEGWLVITAENGQAVRRGVKDITETNKDSPFQPFGDDPSVDAVIVIHPEDGGKSYNLILRQAEGKAVHPIVIDSEGSVYAAFGAVMDQAELFASTQTQDHDNDALV